MYKKYITGIEIKLIAESLAPLANWLSREGCESCGESGDLAVSQVNLAVSQVNLAVSQLNRMSIYTLATTGCSGKIVFFHNSLQLLPSLHRCKRPSKLSTQCEFTGTPIGW